MSKRIDMERREDTLLRRIEVGKERLRLAQAVLTAYVEGITLADTARRLERSRQTVWRIRVWLGLESGTQWRGTGRRTGERLSRKAIEELWP